MQQKSKLVSGTRGQILAMLRLGPKTVSEMAAALHLTENAVRAHLTAFEEDGLVRRAGSLPGTRKPFLVYALTTQGDSMFPKAYGQILAELVKVLEEKLPPNVLAAICTETGKRMAKALAPSNEGLKEADRVRLAVDALVAMGGVATATSKSNVTQVEGRSCPLSEAVCASSHACQFTQSLLTAVTGMSVTSRCQHGSEPRCSFELKAD